MDENEPTSNLSPCPNDVTSKIPLEPICSSSLPCWSEPPPSLVQTPRWSIHPPFGLPNSQSELRTQAWGYSSMEGECLPHGRHWVPLKYPKLKNTEKSFMSLHCSGNQIQTPAHSPHYYPPIPLTLASSIPPTWLKPSWFQGALTASAFRMLCPCHTLRARQKLCRHLPDCVLPCAHHCVVCLMALPKPET
jgi:hypothetical protein